jgi:hypothetical protein
MVRRPSPDRRSVTPVIIGAVVLVIGFFLMKLILNIQRIAPRHPPPGPQAQTQIQAPASRAPLPAATASGAPVAVVPPAPARPADSSANRGASAAVAPSSAPTQARAGAATTPASTASPVAVANQALVKEPEIRRAEPVKPEELAKAGAATAKASASAEPAGPNRIDIRPLKKTYVKVVVDNEATTPAFERWISPADGTVEFRGQHIAVRVLDRDAIQIKKNGKVVNENDDDITVE